MVRIMKRLNYEKAHNYYVTTVAMMPKPLICRISRNYRAGNYDVMTVMMTTDGVSPEFT
jgi:hypothetical protein